MRRSIRLTSLPVLAVTAVLATAPAGSAATNCQKGRERSFKATYVTKITTKVVGCATGRKVVKAFHECRRRKGVSGRCTTKVLGYSCTERRPAAERIPTQYTGYVTCKSGSKRVVQVYQQDT